MGLGGALAARSCHARGTKRHLLNLAAQIGVGEREVSRGQAGHRLTILPTTHAAERVNAFSSRMHGFRAAPRSAPRERSSMPVRRLFCFLSLGWSITLTGGALIPTWRRWLRNTTRQLGRSYRLLSPASRPAARCTTRSASNENLLFHLLSRRHWRATVRREGVDVCRDFQLPRSRERRRTRSAAHRRQRLTSGSRRGLSTSTRFTRRRTAGRRRVGVRRLDSDL